MAGNTQSDIHNGPDSTFELNWKLISEESLSLGKIPNIKTRANSKAKVVLVRDTSDITVRDWKFQLLLCENALKMETPPNGRVQVMNLSKGVVWKKWKPEDQILPGTRLNVEKEKGRPNSYIGVTENGEIGVVQNQGSGWKVKQDNNPPVPLWILCVE